MDSVIAEPSEAVSTKKNIWQGPLVHIILIMLLGILVYSNTFYVPFHFDDIYNIVDNPSIKDFQYFSDPSKIQRFKPLYDALRMRYIGYLTFAINYKLHGLNVTGYHVFNLAIHIVNAILIYFIVLLTLKTPYFSRMPTFNNAGLIALFPSLLFVSHPVQTQAVTYIVQRLASLATMFYLLSLVMYIKARLKHAIEAKVKFFSATTSIFYLLSIFSAILAMKTKEIAFTLPVIISLYEFMFFKGDLKKRLLFLTPIVLTMLIIPLGLLETDKYAGDLLSGIGETTRVETTMSRLDYLFTQFRVIVTYIRLIFFPVNQNIDYDYPVFRSFFEPQVFLSFIFLLSIFGLGVYLFYCSKMRGFKDSESSKFKLETLNLKLISFGIFWFFITLSVESSIIPIMDVIFEHRLYLPSAGAFIALSASAYAIFNKFKGRHKATTILIASSLLILCALSIASYARNNLWRNPIALWEDAVRKSPNKARGYNNLGFLYTQTGQNDKAIDVLRKAAELKKTYSTAHHNLGLAYAKKGMIDEAIKELRLAVESDPSNALANYDLALAYIEKGQMENALQQLQNAIKFKPDYAEAYNNIGAIYLTMNLIDEAIENFETALRFKPDNAEAHFNAGSAYKAKGMHDKADEHFKIAKMLRPDKY